MHGFTNALLGALVLAILNPGPAGAQVRGERLISQPADTGVATLDPGALQSRRGVRDLPTRAPMPVIGPPSITAVPADIHYGDMITVKGANFVSPSVELYAPVPNSVSSELHFPLMPLQVTSESFKLIISKNKVGTTNPNLRLRVTTPYGTDTTESQLRLTLVPRVDTITVGGAWRQVGTPQQWWQRIIWVSGRNLYGYESASVGSTYVPISGLMSQEQDGVVLQINVPRSCSEQGTVTINFSPNRVPPSGPVTAGQVTCLPNDQISAP
jgi:hypothetical protein